MRTRSLVLFALLLVPGAFAIGVSPPSAQINFAPGESVEFMVRVLNFNDFPVEIETRTTGVGAFELDLPRNIPAQSSAAVRIRYTMPAELSRPGTTSSYVFFKERYIDEKTSTFAVRTEVGMRVDVWQPYPGSYAEIVVSAQHVPEGEDSVLGLVVNNLGVEPLEGETARVRVLSAEQRLQDVFTFPGISIPGNSNERYSQVIKSSAYAPGKYTLAGELEYPGGVARMNSTFIVGTQDVDILSVEDPMYLDKPVNKFRVRVESLWNQPMEGVYGTFQLGEYSATTSPVIIPPFGIETLSGYWETDPTVASGEVLARVRVIFPGGVRDELVPVMVYNETPRAPLVQEPALMFGLSHVIFAGLALLIVVCLVVFAVSRLRRKEQPKDDLVEETKGP